MLGLSNRDEVLSRRCASPCVPSVNGKCREQKRMWGSLEIAAADPASPRASGAK